ncbi:uncharacterized protein EI90DRAFT_3037698 [Cantharellus anzutake]|uniref:uncharacterized protein n=1 Tax=Cantharellus anzutake TaxID=1750568 RepID=UPI001908C4CB|nr:uncharacterized protein EI90DRAFT_3037698 [Cantharellus anzutake]KAF8339767.1 hypothetical protein EI90DRAFT_3037698 [Cantharellus anzutake]
MESPSDQTTELEVLSMGGGIKSTPQPRKIRRPRSSSVLTPGMESSILAKTKGNRTVSEILLLRGQAVGAGSGAHRLGLSNKVRIAPLHARIKTPPPVFRPLIKRKEKNDEDDMDSEEEYEGLTEAQIAERREQKMKAAWYSP